MPPYSQHWDPSDRELDARFKDYGVAPKSKADYAFLLHELHHLKPDGILTIVLPHGVLFRGGEEEQIRKNLIEKNNIDAIIGLPANIFFGTGIPTLIMVLKQHRDNDDILIVDASKGYVKDGKQNKLRACDIKRIADTVRDRKTIEGFSRQVSRDEIRVKNEYNLNIPRYVTAIEPVVKYDIHSTMFGGIPNSEIDDYEKYWTAFPSLRSEIFKADEKKPYSYVSVDTIKTSIETNNDVIQFLDSFEKAFDGFADSLHEKLISNVSTVKEMIAQDEISEDIFRRLEHLPLIDKYAAYQALADNWPTIVNDVEMIQTEGFNIINLVEPAYKIIKKNDEDIEVADGIKGRIIPFELIQQEKFQEDLAALNIRQNRIDEIKVALEEMCESFAADDELSEYLDEEDNTKFNKKKVVSAVKDKNGELSQSLMIKLKEVDSFWKEMALINGEIKVIKSKLIDNTKTAIEGLSQAEAEQYLRKKWINPVIENIRKIAKDSIAFLEDSLIMLSEKYALTFSDIEEQIKQSKIGIASLIEQIVGSESDMVGLHFFNSIL